MYDNQQASYYDVNGNLLHVNPPGQSGSMDLQGDS